MKIRNYKENQNLLSSVSEYLTIYRSLVAEHADNKLSLSSAVHNLLMPITEVYLNWDRSEPMLTDKNDRTYQPTLDAWATSEFEKSKSLLAEMREMRIPSFDTGKGGYKTETDFLSFLKMVVTLRYRPLLAHSWRIEYR